MLMKVKVMAAACQYSAWQAMALRAGPESFSQGSFTSARAGFRFATHPPRTSQKPVFWIVSLADKPEGGQTLNTTAFIGIGCVD